MNVRLFKFLMVLAVVSLASCQYEVRNLETGDTYNTPEIEYIEGGIIRFEDGDLEITLDPPYSVRK